jgi:RNA recognition motif-containing protein
VDFICRVKNIFGQERFPIPKNATSTIFVEGIPVEATEREVAHIFRPYYGFKSVRLIPRDKGPDQKVILCFADFENPF